MKNFLLTILLASVTICSLQAQCVLGDDGTYQSPAGGDCANLILTAVPFLRITPDARAASMGDAGIAISPDANSIAFNASKLAFAEEQSSISATYTPWLRELGVTDVYLAYLAGYFKIDELQAFSGSLRYFSLGDVQFTNMDGQSLGIGKPNEFEISAAYARKLSDKLSAGLTAKFILSNLANGVQAPDGSGEINAGTSGAVDISFTYLTQLGGGDLTVGLALTNIGSKITYIQDLNKDFIPTNFGLGLAYSTDLDDYNSLTFALDINKLMVPTPIIPTDSTRYDVDPADGIADHRQKGLFSGILGSFGDAPGGFTEELQEFYFSLGAEYWYNKQFAVRLGYFFEHQNKGNRKYLTAGLGLNYQEFGLNVSYLVPTSNQRSALDNTLRFSVTYTPSGGEG